MRSRPGSPAPFLPTALLALPVGGRRRDQTRGDRTEVRRSRPASLGSGRQKGGRRAQGRIALSGDWNGTNERARRQDRDLGRRAGCAGRRVQPARDAQRLRHCDVPAGDDRAPCGRYRRGTRRRRADRQRHRLHLGPGPGRDGHHRDRDRRRGRRAGIPGVARLRQRALGSPSRRGERRGGRTRLHAAGALRPCPGRRRGPPARAVRRTGRAARGSEQPAVPCRHGLAAGGAGAAHLGLGGRGRVGRVGSGLAGLPPRHRAARGGRPRGAYRRPPPGRHPGDHLPHAGGPARRRRRGEPPRAGRVRHLAGRCGGRRRSGRIRRQVHAGDLTVRLGVTAALTDRDLTPATLGAVAEELGFDSLYLPEHTHLPVREDTPPALVEGVRPDDYKRCLDPLVALATAAASTTRLRLGTGILLVAQHDPIILAKQVATLDHISGGRLTMGVGFGWNRAEAEDHGVDFARRHAVAREHLGAMEAIWSTDEAEYHGEFVDFDPTWSWPKPVQQPRVRTLIGGGATDAVLGAVVEYADGWIPIGGRGLTQAVPRLSALAETAGRDPATLGVVPFGTIADEGKLEHFAGLGITEVVLRIRAGDERSVRAELESLAPLVPFAATLGSP